jgi:hypothetical protein
MNRAERRRVEAEIGAALATCSDTQYRERSEALAQRRADARSAN